jgi:tripartite-type tricarboxylate transporter receptor subunit TctC
VHQYKGEDRFDLGAASDLDLGEPACVLIQPDTSLKPESLVVVRRELASGQTHRLAIQNFLTSRIFHHLIGPSSPIGAIIAQRGDAMISHLVRIFATFAMLVIALPAMASDWPSRTVRIIVPFAAGGNADIMARMLADHLANEFKQQFIVETRPGAAGSIGLRAVSSAPPDGYTFLLGTVSVLTLLPVINPKLDYDALRDLTNIAYVAGSPAVLSVNPQSGFSNLKDFVDRARTASTPFTFASTGLGSDGHLIGLAFASAAKINVVHLPYKGASQGIIDLLGGHVTFATYTLASTSSSLSGNSLTGLAVTSSKRVAAFPDIPTFKELGYPSLVSTTWFSFSGPAKLPKEIAEKLNRSLVTFLSKAETKTKLEKDGLITEPMNIEEFDAFLRREAARWEPIITNAGLVQK